MFVALLSRLTDAPRRLTGICFVAAAFMMSAAAHAQTTFVVTNTANDGAGSLRQAIADANAGSGGTITFDIASSDPGFNVPGTPNAWRISLTAPLPPIQRPTSINGLSQPGSSCSAPKIEIRPGAGGSGFTGDGLAILANDCQVRGLVINGFVDNGVSLTTVTGCTVSCNFIGTDVTGGTLIGNGTGILISNGVNNRIGGTDANAGNLIAGNLGAGVSVVSSGTPSNVGNAILRNSIRDNGGLGIDLAANGVTDNDQLDLDVGPNHFQNYPVITAFDGGTITATLDSLPNRRFRVEFFANTAQDPTTFGEGAVFIQAVEVLSSPGGSASMMIPYTPGPGVRYVTATATSLPPLRFTGDGPGITGNFSPRGIAPAAPTGTSEFARAFLVGGGGGNTPPVAQPLTVSTPEDTDVTISLIATDIDNQPLTLRIASLPAAGQLFQFGTLAPISAAGAVVTDGQGRVVYRPSADAFGSPFSSFTYIASDGELDSNAAAVTINVTPVNDPPVALDDGYATNEDTILVVSTRAAGVLGNDTDPENSTLAAAIVAQPARGSVLLAGDGTFVYTPDPNLNGPDSFTYRANDGSLDSNIATVTINVTAVNDAPIAVDDAYAGDEDTALVISSIAAGILSNDTDAEGDTLTATVVGAPARGAVVLNPDGTFTYTPEPNYAGPDSFTYRARDAAADSNIAAVRIALRGVNDPPVANDDTYSTSEDTPLTVAAVNLGVLANDTDPDMPPQTLTATLVTTTSRGTLTFNPNGTFTYSPQPNFNGTDTFTYRANDGAATSNIAIVTISVGAVNDPPVARNDSYFTNEDTALTVPAPGVLINDGDVDNDINAAMVTIVTPPAGGALSNVAAGGFRYTPSTDFTGTDTFTYRLSDGTATSNIATVSIIVQPLNDPPVAVSDSYTTSEDVQLTIATPGVLVNDTDPDSPASALTAQLVSAPSPTSAAFALAADGSFTFVPTPDFNGDVTFTYRVSDGTSSSAPATVTIRVTPVNDAPIAVDDTYTTPLNTPLSIAAPGVLENDFDIDSSALIAAIVTAPTSGTVTLAPSGGFLYTPATDFTGTATFTYRASDNERQSEAATVLIAVGTGGNLPPIARCRDVTIDARQSCPPTFSITPADVNNGSSDPDDTVESLVLTLSNSGPFGVGVTEVTLTVTDPHGASSSCTANVTVLGEDCNGNGLPDACDIASGTPDCNRDGVPDECQCLWDNGMATPTSDGRYSQFGGRAQVAPKVADDFYIEPGQVCRVTSFTGQMFTNLLPALRRAKLEFYEDCDGSPSGNPFAVFANSTVVAAEPGGGVGASLVTFSFDLCSANLWLDGGKTYWVSLYAVATCSDGSESYWAAAPGGLSGSVPRHAIGHPLPSLCTSVRYDPWADVDTCCGDCQNMAFKLGGVICPIIWDNGPYWHCPGGGGLPSGRNGAFVSRSADNFVVKPCDDQTVCFIEATVWTNCNPATGFVEIFDNQCKQPGTRLFAAPVSRAIATGETIQIGSVAVQAYILQFYDLGWTLPAGRTYWLSAGATGAGGSINQRSYFAIADTCGTGCDIKISPAWSGNVGVGGAVMFCAKTEDLSFRIGATPGIRRVIRDAPPIATCLVDLDGDGEAGVQDLFTFLAAWFAGCP